jgi:hypothetical protein
MATAVMRLTRIDAYAMCAGDFLIVTTAATSIRAVDLIGSASKTARGGWRVLRWGLVDLGYVTSATEAVDLIVEDALRIGRPQTKAAAIAAVEPVVIPGKGARA